jgi:phosphoribosyl 1,2-cyclic phosphodiesterase
VSLQLSILGSGSAGNCTYLESDGTWLLVDAGLSGRQIRQRLLTVNRTPENLNGILITHEHMDHTGALGVLAAKLQIPVYCNRMTKEAIQTQTDAHLDFRVFETGASFEIGSLSVDTFAVPHDASDPVGYLIHTPGRNIGVVTDLGHVTKLVVERVRQSNILLLETNHDLKMLQEDMRRPWSVKQRIASRHGHLDNGAAAQLAEQIVSADLHHVFLTHLSLDCNKPELAFAAVSQTLQKVGAKHVHVELTYQDKPSAHLVLNGEVKRDT